MSMELNMAAPLYGGPAARPHPRAEKGISALYAELLRSACTLGEILEAAGRGRSKSRRGDTSPVKRPPTGCAAVVARINSGIASAGEGLPGSEPAIPKPADGGLATGGGISGRSGGLERFRPGGFSNLAKDIAFAVLCTGVIAAAGIAGFAILRGDRDSAATTSRVQPAAFARTAAAATAPVDASDDAIALILQAPPAPPTAAAEPVPRSDAAQPHEAAPSGAMPRRDGTAIAKLPVEKRAPVQKMPAAAASRAHVPGTHKANAPRRYAEASRRDRRQTPARYPQPVSNAQRSGSYNTDFDRGYSYGGPAAHSDSGS